MVDVLFAINLGIWLNNVEIKKIKTTILFPINAQIEINMVIDQMIVKMNVKCHACGKFGHFSNHYRSRNDTVFAKQFKRTMLHVMHATN